MKAGRSVTGVLFLTLFLDLVGFSIIFPLFPALLEHYLAREGPESAIGELAAWLQSWTGAERTDDWRVQVLFGGLLGSVYSLLQFLFSPVWGRISDRVGRRPVLIVTVAGLALSHFLWVVAGSFTLFLLARVLGGVMSGNIATATAAMADVTSQRDRARGMGIIGAAFGLGFVLGPALGGALMHLGGGGEFDSHAAVGWHPFSVPALAAGLLSLANLAWVARRFPETLPPEQRGRSTQHRTANPLALFDAGLGAGLRRTNFAYLVFIAAFSGMEFTLAFLARDRLQWGPVEIAWLLTVAGLIIAAVQGGLVRRLAPRFGERRVAVAGLLLIVPGLLILARAGSGVAFYAGLVPMAVGSALAIPTLTALASLYAPPDRQGAALGAFRSVGALGRVLGPLAAALAYAHFDPHIPYLWGAVLLLVPVTLALTLPSPTAHPNDVSAGRSQRAG